MTGTAWQGNAPAAPWSLCMPIVGYFGQAGAKNINQVMPCKHPSLTHHLIHVLPPISLLQLGHGAGTCCCNIKSALQGLGWVGFPFPLFFQGAERLGKEGPEQPVIVG